ncbi:MAG: chemotaxis protein CheC [Ruminiclostridium sp.]|nr:chemotaxis protein CheC [Ruminiclostridium sp.]
MSIGKYEDLNAMQIDVLREVGNIGSGNATTALSSMVGKMIDIEVPNVEVLGFNEAIDAVGGPEKVIAGVLIRINGDVDGMIMFLFEQNLIALISETFFGAAPENIISLNEAELSALTEMGNIMAGSYVNAISQLAGLTIDVEPPMMTIDMLGAIMSVPAIEMGEMGDKLLFIDNNMIIDKTSIQSKMLLLPTIDSLDHLLGKLGVA